MTENKVFLVEFLTREELLALYGYQWVAHVFPAYGAEQMSSDERDKTFESVGSGLRWAIRELAERGAVFANVYVDPRGEIRPAGPPICPQNKLLVFQFDKGSQIGPTSAIPETLRFLERHGIRIDRGPLLEVLHQATLDSKAAIELIESDPETHEAMRRYIDEVYEKAGFVRRDKTPGAGGPVN